jgi:hypothetical protein
VYSVVSARQRTKLALRELRIKYLEAKMKEKQSVAAELPAGNVQLIRTAPVGTRFRIDSYDTIKAAAGPVMLFLSISRRCLFSRGSNPKRFQVAAISVAAAGM